MHIAKRTTLKTIRMSPAFNRVLMILAPTCPPANEATAAGRMNAQLIDSVDAYPRKPVNDEKQTITV